MLRKIQLRKLFLTRTSVNLVNFAIDRTAYSAQLNGEKGAALAVRNLLVKPDFVYAGDKSFGDLVTEKMPSYGDEWSGVNLKDSKMVSSTLIRLRLNLIRLRKLSKHKVFNSQFTWTFQLTKLQNQL